MRKIISSSLDQNIFNFGKDLKQLIYEWAVYISREPKSIKFDRLLVFLNVIADSILEGKYCDDKLIINKPRKKTNSSYWKD